MTWVKCWHFGVSLSGQWLVILSPWDAPLVTSVFSLRHLMTTPIAKTQDTSKISTPNRMISFLMMCLSVTAQNLVFIAQTVG